jgi:hypothetical protein
VTLLLGRRVVAARVAAARLGPALALAGALALSGCAGRIWLDHESGTGATLHWYTRETTIDAARARAEEHCRHLAKRAVLLDEFEDQDITTAHFACR